jgi:CHRD domain
MRRRLLVVGALICALALVAGVVLVSGAGAASARRVASLVGEEEVPGPGDDNGRGRAVVNLNVRKRRVCFDLSWRRIGAPTAAHIHPGRKGEMGDPVVVFFQEATPLPSSIRGVQGCARGVERALIRDIREHPRRFYVNIHNEAFPAGAIRGQLRRR